MNFGNFTMLRLMGAPDPFMPMANGKGGGDPPPPDPNIGKAQAQMAQLANQQYADWHSQVWPEVQAQMTQQNARADQYYNLAQQQAQLQNQWGQAQHDVGMGIQQQQLQSMRQNQSYADQYHDRMVQQFYPVENQLISDAKNYNTPGNVERQSALAMGDVHNAFAGQRAAQAQQMQAYGVNPTSGAYQGQQNASNISEAAQSAAAGTRARDAAVQLGWAKNMDVASLGRGLPGSQATSTGLAQNAGMAGLNAGQAGMANMNASMAAGMGGLNAGQMNVNNAFGMGNALNSGYAGAQNGWAGVGNLATQSYGIQSNNWRTGVQSGDANSAGIGQFLGTALGAAAIAAPYLASDVRMKQEIVLVGVTPGGAGIYEFDYLPAYRDSWGHGRQRGVMAQELELLQPEAVAVLADGMLAVDYSRVR